MAHLAPTPRTRVRRVPKRGLYDRAAIEAILDEALYCHLGFVQADQPYVIPMLHARVGDVVYVHGSAASRAVRTLGGAAPACLTVTLADGVVLARSAFHHSLNYRSVVLLGTMHLVTGRDEQLRALEAFTEQLVPGRWAQVRPPSPQELKGTSVLALPLTEASAKVRTGPPIDDDEDLALDVWAGVVPLHTVAGAPEPDAHLAPGTPAPEHVADWRPTPGRR
jgi:nitroimidazol reductase NimA-like FMN-containing flavoprotein (pyridoxamine 5'-phosphate oxidase superfamily)